jgi:hypothetical protein
VTTWSRAHHRRRLHRGRGRDGWPSDERGRLSDYMQAISRARHYVSGPERLPIEQVTEAGSPSYLSQDELSWARPLSNSACHVYACGAI